VSYELYRMDNSCTLKIEGLDRDKILKVSDLIVTTDQSKTLEEQFYGITVLDNRILDTKKITINAISNEETFLGIDIKVDENPIGIRFLYKKYISLPTFKNINNWNLVTEEDNYKIYHGYSNGIDSDALKIVKDDKEYYIDLSLPPDLYKHEKEKNSDGGTTIHIYPTQETIEKIAQEIINILE